MKPFKPLAVLCFALSLIGGAFAVETAPRLSIPLSIDEADRMSVWINIGDKTTIAAIDTAATFPMIDQKLLNEENSVATGAQVEVLGVGGSRLFAEAELDAISIGELEITKLAAAMNGRTSFPGHKNILPAKLFEGRVLDFDFRNGRLDAYHERPERMGDHVTTKLDYTNIGGLPFVQVKVNGVTGLALIDTGSDVTYLNSVFAREAGAILKVDKTQEIFGATGVSDAQVKIMDVKKMSVGRHSQRKFEMLSADTPIFEHLGLQEEAVMVLGLDFLRHFRLQIDRDMQRIYLGRPESEAEGRRYHISPFSGRVRRYSETARNNL